MKVKVTNKGGATRVFYDSKHKAVPVDPGQTVTVDIETRKFVAFQKNKAYEVESLEDEDETPAPPATTRVRLTDTPVPLKSSASQSETPIPEGWQDLKFQDLRNLAGEFSETRVTNRTQAENIIKAELNRRG